MADFDYTALDKKGKQTSGTIVAEDEAGAIAQLRKSGSFPTRVQQVATPIDQPASAEDAPDDETYACGDCGTSFTAGSRPVAGSVACPVCGEPMTKVGAALDSAKKKNSDPAHDTDVSANEAIDIAQLPVASFEDDLPEEISGDGGGAPDVSVHNEDSYRSTREDTADVLPTGASLIWPIVISVLCLIFAIQGGREWWFYFGWLGIIVIAIASFLCVKVMVWAAREEVGWFIWMVILMLFASVSTKAPRPAALWLWEDYRIEMGGFDWVSDPAYGPHQGRWPGSLPPGLFK